MATAASLRKVGVPSSGHQKWDILLIFSRTNMLTYPSLLRPLLFTYSIVTCSSSGHGLV